MDNQVDEIKQKLNIVDVINRYVPLKKRGRTHMACCPFHGEKTPSFTVSEELQIFKCFGCGKAGDIFTFLQEYEKIDFREALEELAKLAGVTLQKSEFTNHQDSQKKTLIEINTQVAKFYNYILTSHPLGKEALDYVLNRGITLDTIKTFNIGFSPKDSRHLINYISKKNFSQKDLIETGTFGISNYNKQLYDRFQDRLIFPLPNYRGNIVGFSGRILPSSQNPNLAKYINSPETPIYHKSQMLFGLNLSKEPIRIENSVIVTEGEFDMISPYQAGIKNIVALKGTAFTPEQLQLLRRYTDTLILALDSDFAGSNAARKSIELADSMAFDIKVLTLGDKYKDPDEAIKADLDFFKSQLKNTISVWDFIINSMIKANDINTVKGKQTVLQNVLPFLVKISNAVIRSDYFHKLATEIGSSEDAIYEESKKYLSIRSPSEGGSRFDSILVPINIQTPTIVSKTEKFEELLLTLIIGAKNPFKLSKNLEKYLNYINTPRFQLIAKALLSKDFDDLKDFQDNLAPELQPVFQDLYFASNQQNLESEDRLVEIKKVTNQIATVYLKDELTRLSSQIAQLESADDETGLIEVEAKYNQILSELSSLQIKK